MKGGDMKPTCFYHVGETKFELYFSLSFASFLLFAFLPFFNFGEGKEAEGRPERADGIAGCHAHAPGNLTVLKVVLVSRAIARGKRKKKIMENIYERETTKCSLIHL